MKRLTGLIIELSLLGLMLHAPAAAGAAPFSERLHAKFHHDRCLACHQFNSARSQGLSYTTHRNRYLCESCHRPEQTGLPPGEWQAPIPRLDYSGLGPRETCELIKRNAGTGDLKRQLRDHLLDDLRIRWALESGMTPLGRFPTIEGGYAAWREDVLAWLEGGMRCD
ncbi:MAG: hypothetical protein NZ524_11185 [Thiobacillaceae bacterium]|nr:hypothetical protein [Thiobacillaceae bacterium]MCX7674162.1 hypothetical protein [Thiobacillaceae bacterium]MDW8323595.1 hypothetical protein [Burkholderiales bacterium]